MINILLGAQVGGLVGKWVDGNQSWFMGLLSAVQKVLSLDFCAYEIKMINLLFNKSMPLLIIPH